MKTPDTEQLTSFAEFLADKARAVSLQYFRGQLDIEAKSDQSPVTVADRETELLIRDLIMDRYPDHGLYGEEHGVSNPASNYTWVIDPIDGTRNFIAGMPIYGTLVALLENGLPIIGIVDMPALDERWVGVKGKETLLNGINVQTRISRKKHETVWYTTSSDLFSGDDLTAFNRLKGSLPACRFGIDCYAFCLLSSGFVDLVVETQLKPYDFLALVPVIEGAGGIITDWRGCPLDLNSTGQVIAAADNDLHSRTLSLLAAPA